MSIEMLDVYTLAKVFSYLDTIGEKLKMESVCKKWRKACRNSIAWKNIKKLDLIQGNYAIPKFSDSWKIHEFFHKLLNKFGTHLTNLSFLADKSTMLVLSELQDYCCNLTHLEIEFKRYSDFHLQTLMYLDECINDELFEQMTKLKSFTALNYFITNDIVSFASDTKLLESLNPGIEEIMLTASSPRLLILSPIMTQPTKIKKWHSLKKLTLDLWSISDSLWDIFTSKNSLTYLNLYRCEISKSQILKLTQLKNLETLILSKTQGVHNLLLFKIVKELKNLKQLNVSWCDELSTEALRKIGDLKNLNFLSMMFLDNVDDSVVMKIVDNCRMLEYLNLSGCDNPTNVTLYNLGKLEHLKTLHVDGMDQIDNRTFNYIKNLESLGCEECKNLGDAGVQKLLKFSPNIEKMNVSKTRITVKSLYNFCNAKANNDGKQFYMKADATVIFEYLSVKKQTPDGVCFIRPFDVDSEDGSYYSDDGLEFYLDDESEEDSDDDSNDDSDDENNE